MPEVVDVFKEAVLGTNDCQKMPNLGKEIN
jgi:hypothetical protein